MDIKKETFIFTVFITQLFIGKKATKQTKKKQQPSHLPTSVSVPKSSFKKFNDSDDSIMVLGSVVAVYLQKYPEFPQIGKVRSIDNNAITISWYDGAFNDIWSMVKLKKGEEWSEKIDKKSILLYDIEFTRGQRLKKDAHQALKKYYDEFVNTE